MQWLPYFYVRRSRAFYRPVGSVSTGELADLVTAAIKYCRARHLGDILINIAALTGFDSPGPAYRRWVVQKWSTAAGKRLRVAMVARVEHVCPDKTGLLVAAEEAFQANIFTAETAAVSWLDSLRRQQPVNGPLIVNAPATSPAHIVHPTRNQSSRRTRSFTHHR